MTGPRAWRRALPPRVDAVAIGLVAALTVACVFAAPLSAPDGFVPGGDLRGVVIALGMTLPLAWRRAHPLLALLVAAIFGCGSNLYGYATDPADILLLFGLAWAAYTSSRRTCVALAGLATVYQLVWWVSLAFPKLGVTEVASALASGVLPVAVGDALRQQRRYLGRIAEIEGAAAAERERLRIARELHDIVGHHISAIGVQVRAIQTLVDSSPARARAALDELADLTVQALDETRLSVGLLRDGESDRHSQPGLGQVQQLVDTARSAGVEVTLSLSGEPGPVRASTELCAYRVIQEALTNVVRHAGPRARAEVILTHGPSTLTVAVVSTSADTLAPTAGHGHGHGLVGMRERVEQAGGRLDVGAIDDHTWRVRAELPTTR